MTGNKPGEYSRQIHLVVDKINRVIKVEMHGHDTRGMKNAWAWYQWQMENKQCVGVSRDQWRTSIAWVKGRDHVGCVGVLKQYKVKRFGWRRFQLAVLILNSSFVCTNSSRLFFCSGQGSPSKNKKYFYVYVLLVYQYPAVVYYNCPPFRGCVKYADFMPK